MLGKQHFAVSRPGALPRLTSNGQHALMPGDFATIYNINPLYFAGVNGQHATIAVVARSNFQSFDPADFLRLAGLPSPTSNVVSDGPSPGS